MKALVTGGGGFLGSVIVRMLRERGDSVCSFSRGSYPVLELFGVEQVRGDLGDALAIAKAADGCDAIFHVAAKAGVWGPWREYYQANVVGTQNVLAACRTHGIRKLVYTSSPSVTFAGVDQNGVDESEPYPKKFLAHYPHTKAIAEQAVLTANGPDLATVALRPHLIWGPGDPHIIPRLVERARAGKLRQIGREPKLVDTTFVENAAQAHLQAADRLGIGSSIAGRAYYLSQGEPEPMWDFVNRVLSVHGLPPVTRSVSPRMAYLAGTILEWLYRLLPLGGEPPITRFVAKQLSTAHWYDLSAAKGDLGYEPRVSLAEGFRRLSDSLFRSEGPVS
ncbi:MAG: NAD-dependent epimerase/dehydratase family protein [Gemmataceae bacterium]|nr:NAD-dependent epimerase/dehydratase family protein [Gemmataceae bacterium]